MGISDLQLSRDPTLLPVTFESLFAATLADQLHLVGLDEYRRAAHVVVDARGEVVAASSVLPLMEVTGLTECAGSLVVSGVTTGDYPAVLLVERDGRVAWRAELPQRESLQHWPRPVCAGGATWLFSMTSGAHAAMWLSPVAGHSLGAPLSFALADDTDTIDVLGEAAGILVARVHADAQRLELMRIEGDGITARRQIHATRPTSPSLARCGDRIALAWVTAPSEPRLQWFDQNLLSLSASEVLVTPPRSGEVKSVRLMSDAEGTLAIVFRSQNVPGDGRSVRQADGTVTRQEPRRCSPLEIAAYDRDSGHIGPLHLVDQDAKVYAGAWLDNRFAVAHRRDETRLSIFERKVLKNE